VDGERAGIETTECRLLEEGGRRHFMTRRSASLKRGRAETILAAVVEAVGTWPELAAKAGVDDERIAQIERAHRLDMPRGANA
jgi:hypothetical protein